MACGEWRKPSHSITDRAHRQRAQQCAPPGPRTCEVCGSKRFITVDHRDGDEWNDDPHNLRWLCKSCNTREGIAMSRAGIGRRTRQYNAPRKTGAGAQTLGEYVRAAVAHRRGKRDAGGAVIHATPDYMRRKFAAQIWKIRKYHGNPYAHEDIANVPPGWHVRTIAHPSGHQVRVAFPPGPRAAGSGEVISILHPNSERNPKACKLSEQVRRNPIDVITPLITGIAAGATFGVGNAIAQKYLVKRLPNGGSRIARTGVSRRRNEDGSLNESLENFADFHGRTPQTVMELQAHHIKAGSYDALGSMGKLWTVPIEKGRDPESWPKPQIAWSPSEGVKLASDASRMQLYFIGGNQDLDAGLLAAGIAQRRWVRIGPCTAISYITEKRFDGFATSEYCHPFGEKTGALPVLWYDATHQAVFLVGGEYRILPFDAKLGASPGIEN